MKYRTFRNLVLLGGATTLAGLTATCFHFAGSTQTGGGTIASGASPTRVVSWGGAPVTTSTPYPVTRVSTAPAAPATQPQSGQRREEQLILSFLASQAATTDKVKDAFPRERFKVNFYRDDAGPNWTRLKIDSDRDGKDDEKWDLVDGQPAKRRVATRDDEQYDREYRWRNAQWVEKE